MSDFFNCDVGLLQGEIISPILFSLFVNDIEVFLQNDSNSCLTLDQLSIYLLLFADDAVLFSETADGLQQSLNNLKDYCQKWKLKVNVEKTKVVIFKKGGRINRDEHLYYDGEILEIVSCFNYLGIVFSSGGSFMNATKTLADKALKAMGSLFAITRDLEVPVNIMLNLFDSYVASILNYSSEVWGFIKAENIERVHRKFMKWLLNVKMSTTSSAVYGELGRFPLYIDREIRIVKYFLKLHDEKNNNCILSSTISKLKQDAEDNNVVNWASKVRDLLQNAGFNDVWLFPSSVDINKFTVIFRTRLQDIYVNNWRQDISSRSSLLLFKEIKPIFEISEYLTKIKCPISRYTLAKLRLSSHQLFIETGRHRNIDRNDRKCQLCQCNDIEDEFHFVLICSAYTTLRKQCIPRYYYTRPSMLKFTELLQCTNANILNKLANYCKKTFDVRRNSLNH